MTNPFTVPKYQYERVLEQKLPDMIDPTIKVDRRGYAEEVAHYLGNNYLAGRAILFAPEQVDSTPVSEDNNVMDALLDDVYENSGLVDAVTTYGPLVLDTAFSLTEEGYELVAEPVDTYSVTAFDAVYRGFQELEALDRDTLEDPEYVSELLEWSEAHGDRYDVFEEVTASDTAGRITVPEFTFAAGAIEGTADSEQVTVDDLSVSREPVSGSTDWSVNMRYSVDGVVDSPTFTSARHGDVNVIVCPSDDFESLAPSLSTYLDDAYKQELRNSYNFGLFQRVKHNILSTLGELIVGSDSDLQPFGATQSMHGDVNVVVFGPVHVESAWQSDNITLHGDPSPNPKYRFYADASNGETNVYHVQPEQTSLLSTPDQQNSLSWPFQFR